MTGHGGGGRGSTYGLAIAMVLIVAMLGASVWSIARSPVSPPPEPPGEVAPPTPSPVPAPLGPPVRTVTPAAPRPAPAVRKAPAPTPPPPPAPPPAPTRFRWPDDWPAELQPEGFEARTRASLEACDTPLNYEGVDCSVPPCILLLSVARDPDTRRPGDWESYDRFLSDCSSWSDTYGHVVNRDLALSSAPATHVHGMSRAVWCADGREFWYLMVVPEAVFRYLNVDEPFEFQQARQAIGDRHSALAEAWACPG